MLYLLSNLEIVDSNIVKDKRNVWACNQLITSIFSKGSTLYYHTASGEEITGGTILRESENIIDLIHEGLQIEYKDKWYTIVSLEGLDGLFIGMPSKISNGEYQIIYKTIETVCEANNNCIKLRRKE